MAFPKFRNKIKLLQNGPAASPSPLVRAGLSPISPRSSVTSSFGAASARYLETAELRRIRNGPDRVWNPESRGESLERLRARTVRSCLPPLF